MQRREKDKELFRGERRDNDLREEMRGEEKEKNERKKADGKGKITHRERTV